MKKLQTGDSIKVIAGKYKGKTSTVEKRDEDKVWIKGLNEVKKAVKGQGFVKKHLPIHISNVMYYDEESKKTSRIGITTDKKGKKVRVIKKINKEIKK